MRNLFRFFVVPTALMVIAFSVKASLLLCGAGDCSGPSTTILEIKNGLPSPSVATIGGVLDSVHTQGDTISFMVQLNTLLGQVKMGVDADGDGLYGASEQKTLAFSGLVGNTAVDVLRVIVENDGNTYVPVFDLQFNGASAGSLGSGYDSAAIAVKYVGEALKGVTGQLIFDDFSHGFNLKIEAVGAGFDSQNYTVIDGEATGGGTTVSEPGVLFLVSVAIFAVAISRRRA